MALAALGLPFRSSAVGHVDRAPHRGGLLKLKYLLLSYSCVSFRPISDAATYVCSVELAVHVT